MGIVFLEGGGLYFLFCIMETEAQASKNKARGTLLQGAPFSRVYWI
jgi:hypothetical protein